jgi:sec-independent protein translocase protein TatC
MTFFDHLNTLRRHLWFSVIIFILGFGLSLYLYKNIINLLTAPLESTESSSLYMTTVYEGFLARIRVSLIAGFIITMPVHIINLLIFIFPALRPKEKRTIIAIVLIGFVLTMISLYYAYSFLIPFSIQFLTGSSFMVKGTSFLLSFTKNVFYLVQFFAAVVVIFQLPLLLILLISLKVVSVESAFKYGRFVIVAAFILSAILTPPDIVSQIMTALPLIFLYYTALLAAKIFRLGER